MPSVPSMEIESPIWYGRVVFSTMPLNTSARVLCSARPMTMAITPDVASRPLTGSCIT
ncbi:hypothetical protein D3C76_1737840 [compost metagenome]